MVSAILLAAGLSSRMGGDKLLLPYRGKPMLQHALDVLAALPAEEKIVVTTQARLGEVGIPGGIRAVINPHPEDGLSGSVRLGVLSATGGWYLFMTADQPLLGLTDIQPILDGAADSEIGIVHPVIGGSPCMPSLFSARFRAKLLSLTGDMGGRAVRDAHPGACLGITPTNPGNFLDIDSLEDYLSLDG